VVFAFLMGGEVLRRLKGMTMELKCGGQNMLSLIIALSFQATADMPDPEAIYRANLSASAREELQLVEKVKALRATIESLPDNWKGARANAQGDGGLLTKQALLAEVESMELSAAERWNVIVSNTAFLDRISEPRAFEARKELLNLPKAQVDLRKRIEELNSKFKDEVLVNLASKVLLN
jgi:hypothetical protein